MKFKVGDKVLINPEAQFGRGTLDNIARFNRVRDRREVGTIIRADGSEGRAYILAKFWTDEFVFFREDELDLTQD